MTIPATLVIDAASSLAGVASRLPGPRHRFRTDSPMTTTASGTEYRVWLARRRVRLIDLATELSERAHRQGRPLRPSEKADYDALSAAVDHVDAEIRRYQINQRYRPPGPRPKTAGYGIAPGSDDVATTVNALIAARRR